MTILETGIIIGESPRWHDGRLWVAHWGAAEILVLDPGAGIERRIPVPTRIPFSIDWLPDGSLLLVSGPEAELLRQEPDGAFVPYADLGRISSHPWNELVVDARGNAYVNGIGFDMMGGAPPSTGQIALVTSDGEARQVADGLAFPNGMAITADGGTLIVAESYGGRLTAYDIAQDGTLENPRVWADLGDHAPDGICLDAEGAVWFADVPHARCVRVREGGEVLDTVELDRGGFACMLGGDDGRTLFMLAAEWGGPDALQNGERSGQVVTVRAPAPRAGRP
ncbi:MAG: SMP-30/gluconolactonase/LRE family protein [Solirubrobacteraceae bacterium]|nr:SMP-30/gluconolactonase/LRE family protein [Solirubrobacteraceae bacterium]